MKKLHSKRLLFEDKLSPGTVVLDKGKIVAIELGELSRESSDVIDHGNHVIMPGLIDSHVHINEPGRTAWEGFDTATRAAAAGGITTLVDMPLNSAPVTTSREALLQKTQAASQYLHVNCGFWGGLVPDNADDLEDLLSSGVLGLKAFLTHSGIDDFPNVTEVNLRAAMSVMAKGNMPLLAHCELDTPHKKQEELDRSPTSYNAYLDSRPKLWENEAIELMIRLAKEYDCPTHIVHLSSADLIPLLQKERSSNSSLTVETCPHYLFFTAEELEEKGPLYKCAPPIRGKANNELLWNGLQDGVLDFIVTDHSPAPPDLKELSTGDFSKAWGGISGLQHSLPAVWTQARQRNLNIEDVCRWMSSNVAKFLGLSERKGKIRQGYDGDLVIWNPEAEIRVTQDTLQYRHKISPYVGEQLLGKVYQTYVNGSLVYDEGNFVNLREGQLIMKQNGHR